MIRTLLIALLTLALSGPALAQLSERTTSELRNVANRIALIEPVPVPDLLLKAIIAAEQPDHLDRRPENSGLTRQLARLHLGAMPTLERRAAEAALAKFIGERLSPGDIVRIYAATVYFGRNCYGYRDASAGLAAEWHTEAGDDVWLALAALPRSPSWYLRDRTALAGRVDTIISEMFDAGLVDQKTAERLESLPKANLHAGKGCSN